MVSSIKPLVILFLCSQLFVYICQAINRLDTTDCGVGTKVCFFDPPGCDASVNGACDAAVVIAESTTDVSSVDISLQRKVDAGQDKYYVAVGFSVDNRMNDDSVVHCKNKGETGIVQGLSYNPADRKSNELVGEGGTGIKIDNMFLVGDMAVVDSDMICHFSRKIVPSTLSPVPNQIAKVFDINKPHYIFLARGPADDIETNGLFKHDRSPVISSERHAFDTNAPAPTTTSTTLPTTTTTPNKGTKPYGPIWMAMTFTAFAVIIGA